MPARFFLILWSVLVLFLVARSEPAFSQSRAGNAVKTEIYFGLRATNGQDISQQQAWDEFVLEVVGPRFPAGLTVLDARGRTGGNTSLEQVKLLVLVHPDRPDAQRRLSEIKAEFRKRFAGAGIFHTDQPISIRSGD